jgi:hypothetical protein
VYIKIPIIIIIRETAIKVRSEGSDGQYAEMDQKLADGPHAMGSNRRDKVRK